MKKLAEIPLIRTPPGFVPSRIEPQSEALSEFGLTMRPGQPYHVMQSGARADRTTYGRSEHPEFFRTLVPPVYADMDGHRQAGVSRFGDSLDLRHACDTDFKYVMQTFSAENCLASAEAVAIPHMPLIDEALEGFPDDHFEGYALLAVQHMYASVIAQFDGLAKKGLKHKDMTVMGKAYSTCFGAGKAMLDRGGRVPVGTLDQSALENHEVAIARTVRTELLRYREMRRDGSAPPNLLIVDDGAHIITMVRNEFPDLLPHVCAVEQTGNGMFKIDAMGEDGPGCTVIPFARAPMKVIYEHPLCARSMFHEVKRKRRHLIRCGASVPRAISINGLGKLGMTTAEVFANEGFKVRGFDIADIRPDHPDIEMIRDRDLFLREARMLLSITGSIAERPPISLADYSKLPHRAMVMNGASGNRELDGAAAIEAALYEQPDRAWWGPQWREDKRAYISDMPTLMANREYVMASNGWLWGELDDKIIPLGNLARPGQRDRVLHFASKDIYMVKNSFVINTTDHHDPIPAPQISLTRGGMTYCMAQAVAQHKLRRVVPMDAAADEGLTKSYLRKIGNPWTSRWEDPTLPLAQDSESLAASVPGTIGIGGAMSSIEARRRQLLAVQTVPLSPSHIMHNIGEPGPQSNGKSRTRLNIVRGENPKKY